MKLKIGDDAYDFDLDRLLISEAREIKRKAGLTVAGFSEGLTEMDPDAIQSAVWLVKTRAGEAVRYEDLDDIDLMSFDVIVEDGDEDGEEDEDPTQAAEAVSDGTSTSKSSGSSTSRSSPKGGTGTRAKSTG